MKLKQFATSIVVAMLLVSMFGFMLVFALPPTVPVNPVISNVFVTNTSDDPVPVDITDSSIDVTLDEPIEVTNPAGEALDVAIPDGVEITNLDEIPETTLELSGWLHTTSNGEQIYEAFNEEKTILIKTEGYQEIDLVFELSSNDVVDILIYQIIDDDLVDYSPILEKTVTLGLLEDTSDVVSVEVKGNYVQVTVDSHTHYVSYFRCKYYITTAGFDDQKLNTYESGHFALWFEDEYVHELCQIDTAGYRQITLRMSTSMVDAEVYLAFGSYEVGHTNWYSTYEEDFIVSYLPLLSGVGMNPEELLTKKALTEPHRTVISPGYEEDQVETLSNALKEMMRKELLTAQSERV